MYVYHVTSVCWCHMIVVQFSTRMRVVLLFCALLGVQATPEHVPVLLWSQLTMPSSPALQQLNYQEFDGLLHEAIGSSNTFVVVFLEESLSNENFSVMGDSGYSAYEDLKAIVSKNNVLYMPSVLHPMKTVRLLEEDGYRKIKFQGEIPNNLENTTLLIVPLESAPSEDRSTTLRRNFQTMNKVYKQLTRSYSSVVAIYTGRRNSWSASNKSLKRERRADDTPAEPLLIRSEGIVAVATAISYKNSDSDEPTEVTGVGSVTATNEDGIISLKAALLPSGELTFVISGNQSRQWSVKVVRLGDKELLPKDLDMWAPVGWSWACNSPLIFKASPAAGAPNPTFTGFVNITGLQIQPDIGDDNKFGQAMDCVPYFSIPIWTGLSVTVLLLAILSWGLMMLMDINTNDRFDDPKGKTITVSATD